MISHILSCNGTEVNDISTSYLIKNDWERFINPHTGTKSDYDKISCHEFMEFNRNLDFFLKSQDFLNDIPIPRGILININSNDFSIAKQLSENNLAITQMSKETKRLYDQCIDLLIKINSKINDLFGAIYIAYMGNYLRYSANAIYNSFAEELELHINFLENLLIRYEQEKFIDLSELLINFFKKNICFKSQATIRTLKTAKTNSYPFINQHFQDLYNFFLLTSEILINKIINKLPAGIYFNIIDLETEELLKKWVGLYYKIITITDFLTFDWRPRISSGEFSHLNLYSRLFNFIQSNESLETKEVLLFLDEIEITMQPMLQKKLISNLIVFLEKFFKDRKFHLFFATHSPVILSDIPKSNTIFLERTGNITKINKQPEIDNTFAANIHSLYRYPYFMEDGTIGKFAERKINEVLNSLDIPSKGKSKDNESKKETETNVKKINFDDCKKIIELIGEPVIKNKLMSLLMEKMPKEKKIEYYNDKIKYYQKKIEDFKTQNNNKS